LTPLLNCVYVVVLQYGLYSAFMGCFVYVLLGTSKDVNIGPTAVMSLLTATFARGSVMLAIVLSLCCGVIQIILGLLHIGNCFCPVYNVTSCREN